MDGKGGNSIGSKTIVKYFLSFENMEILEINGYVSELEIKYYNRDEGQF